VKRDAAYAVDDMIDAHQEEAPIVQKAEAIEILVPNNTTKPSVVLCNLEELSEGNASKIDVDNTASASSPLENVQHLKRRKKQVIVGFWQLVAPDPNFLEEEEYGDDSTEKM
jgi:hypothetical protein